MGIVAALGKRVREPLGRPEEPAARLERARVEVDPRGARARMGIDPVEDRPAPDLQGRRHAHREAKTVGRAEVHVQRGEATHRGAAHARVGRIRGYPVMVLDMGAEPAPHPVEQELEPPRTTLRRERRELVDALVPGVIDAHDHGHTLAPGREPRPHRVQVPAPHERGFVVEEVLPVEKVKHGGLRRRSSRRDVHTHVARRKAGDVKRTEELDGRFGHG